MKNKDNKWEQLQKDVNYFNEEGFLLDDKKFMVFENSDKAIEAIRNNQIPGIKWTAECESKWLKILNEESNATE